MDKKFVIIVMGRPGSGKGTQAELLAKHFNFFHFETTKFLKEYFSEEPDDLRTKKAWEQFRSGQLVESSLVTEIVLRAAKKLIQEERGFVFDGFPRDLYEAERFLPFLVGFYNKENIKVFNVKVSPDEIEQRLEKRLICQKSRHVYIQGVDGLDVDSPCPEDGSLLEKRDMDKPEIVLERFKTYEEETAPAIEYLRKNHEVLDINGEQPIKDVFKDTLSYLNGNS
jgi:adenylate kinase